MPFSIVIFESFLSLSDAAPGDGSAGRAGGSSPCSHSGSTSSASASTLRMSHRGSLLPLTYWLMWLLPSRMPCNAPMGSASRMISTCLSPLSAMICLSRSAIAAISIRSFAAFSTIIAEVQNKFNMLLMEVQNIEPTGRKRAARTFPRTSSGLTLDRRARYGAERVCCGDEGRGKGSRVEAASYVRLSLPCGAHRPRWE